MHVGRDRYAAIERYLPVLGIRSERGYIFPVGTFRGVFTLGRITASTCHAAMRVLNWHQALVRR